MVDEPNRHHPLADCENCPLYERNAAVPTQWNGHDPLKPARFVFVGEAPGRQEVKKGVPFIGISGKLLDATLKELGLSRKDAVLTNAVLCHPQGNDTPPPAAVKACSRRLFDDINKARPEYVVTLGATATKAVMEDQKVKITKARVGPPKHLAGHDWKLIPTVHPAACLRNTSLFPMLAKDLGKVDHGIKVVWEPPRYKEFNSPTQARLALQQITSRRGDTVVIDIEVGEDKDIDFGHPNTLLAVGIGYEPGKVAVVGREALSTNGVREDLSNLLRNKNVVCHNGKYDLGVLHRMGVGTYSLHADTMLMSYALDERPGTHGLKYLGQEELGTPNWSKELDEYQRFADIPPDVLHRYNAYDVGVTWDLMDHLRRRMDESDRRLHDFLCGASDQLMLIESDGVHIDTDALDVLDVEMQETLIDTKKEIRESADALIAMGHLDGHERIEKLIEENGGFNPNSVDQVRWALGEFLGASVVTTDKEMLAYVASNIRVSSSAREFANLMLKWRKVGKLYGTYVKGTKERLIDGRIHPTILLHGTETGRTSARNPNVQNVPRGSTIRSLYSAEPGNLMLYADYSNIEGRVVCVLSQSESMRAVLSDPDRDIHGEVAEMIYGASYSKEQRVLAKTVVHGANYARTPEGIAEGLGVSLLEAKKVHRAYHSLFPEVTPWQQSIKRQVLQTDDVLISPWGNKRRFGLITRDTAEDVYKEALAFLPQCIASNICLTAMIELKKQGFHVRFPIHDGILIEVPQEDADEATKHVESVMMDAGRAYSDYVPWPVEVATGRSWGEVDG